MGLKVVIFVFFLFGKLEAQQPNVCKSYLDYFHMKNNPNCWYNPDVDADVIDIIKLHGLRFEIHNVTTKDGYILTMFRIPKENAKEVFLLQPPLSGSAATYLKSANASLGFALYDAGYDVWLGNSRGTYYSRKHIKYSEHNNKYWDFSFQEIGIYDYSAEAEYIKNITRKKVVMVGYSMSAFSGLIYASVLPRHAADCVKVFILAGPSAYVAKYKLLRTDHTYKMTKFLNTFTEGTIYNNFDASEILSRQFCGKSIFKFFCIFFMTRHAGGSPNNFDPALVPVLFGSIKMRVSLKNLIHYNQISASKRFQFFDYGVAGNLMRYNAPNPPIFPFKDIIVPIFIILGSEDAACTEENLNMILSQLPERAKIYGTYVIKNYNHVDFLFARDSKEKFVDPIIKFAREKL